MLPEYIPDSDEVELICDPASPDVLKVELRNKAIYCLTQAATESYSRLPPTVPNICYRSSRRRVLIQSQPAIPNNRYRSFMILVCDVFKDYLDIAVELCIRLLPLPAQGEGIEFGILAEVYLDIFEDLVFEPCFEFCIISFFWRVDSATYTHGIIHWRESMYLTNFWTICEAFPYHRNFVTRLVTALEDDAATKRSRGHDYRWLTPSIPSHITERLTLLNALSEE